MQTNAFIDTETAPARLLTNAGDNRGFDPAALPDTSRVTFLIDYENGIVVARQNPSIRLDDGAVLTGHPDISVAQESNGKVHIKFNAADPFTPVVGEDTKLANFSVNGDLFYKPTADGGILVGGTTGYYPAWEVNHHAPDGTATAALQELPPIADDPLMLLTPGRGMGDLQLPYEFNNVYPALPGTGEPAAIPGIPHGPVVEGGIPPLLALPPGTTPLGPAGSAPTIPVIDPTVLPPRWGAGMTRHDWIVSIYAGAAWGGIFWAGLLIMTSLRSYGSPPHAALTTVVASIVVGITGVVLFRSTSGTTSRRVGAAMSIGAFIGLPVLAWFALW